MATFTAGQVLTAAEMNALGNDSGWIAVPNGSMSGGWTNGTQAFGYRVIGSRVYLRGALQAATTTGTVLTLPAGFVPVSIFGLLMWDSTGSTASFMTIALGGALAMSQAGSKAWSMDNISFGIN